VRSDPGPLDRITMPFADHTNISAYSHRPIIWVTAKFFELKRIVSGILQEQSKGASRRPFLRGIQSLVLLPKAPSSPRNHMRFKSSGSLPSAVARSMNAFEDGLSLCLRKFRQLVDDLRCTHVPSIIRSRPFVSVVWLSRCPVSCGPVVNGPQSLRRTPFHGYRWERRIRPSAKKKHAARHGKSVRQRTGSRGCEEQNHSSGPARCISAFEGSVLSRTFRAVSIPATGSLAGSRRPSWTRTEAWSQ